MSHGTDWEDLEHDPAEELEATVMDGAARVIMEAVLDRIIDTEMSLRTTLRWLAERNEELDEVRCRLAEVATVRDEALDRVAELEEALATPDVKEDGRPEPDSNLYRHAERELELAGFYDGDVMYGEMLPKAILELVAVFARQGHSGMSASIVTQVLSDLLQFKELSPITSNPDEWNEVGEGQWQSARNPSLFSRDGGQTWYNVNEGQDTVYSEEHPDGRVRDVYPKDDGPGEDENIEQGTLEFTEREEEEAPIYPLEYRALIKLDRRIGPGEIERRIGDCIGEIEGLKIVKAGVNGMTKAALFRRTMMPGGLWE